MCVFFFFLTLPNFGFGIFLSKINFVHFCVPFFSAECCIVEAMKMQNSMKASITGKVKAINVKPGDLVDEDQVLVELE